MKAILSASENSSTIKLQQFKAHYDNKSTKTVFNADPDSKVKRFFRRIGYYLSNVANLVTAGNVQLMSKHSPVYAAHKTLRRDLKENLSPKDGGQQRRPKS